MTDQVKQMTTIRNLSTGEEREVEQTITRDGQELVYTVPNGQHEVRVNAHQYVTRLVGLTGWADGLVSHD